MSALEFVSPFSPVAQGSATDPPLLRGKRSRGFTLVELLVVVAIILILASIALPNFLDAATRAKVAKSENDAYIITTAVEAYILDWQIYPMDHHADWPHDGPDLFGFTMLTGPIQYLSEWPGDPFFTRKTADPRVQNIRSTYYGGSGSDNDACGGRVQYANRLARIHSKDCGHAYAVAGIGPDKDQSFLGWREFPSGDNNYVYPSVLTSYSPSNGTNSVGDIFRLSGDYLRRTVQVNGTFAGN